MKLFFSTGFLTGYFPKAPGTFASLMTALFLFLLEPSLLTSIIFLVFILIAGYWSIEKAEEHFGRDAKQITIDEVAGQTVALMSLPSNVFLYFLGFVLFRFFDIRKPFLIKKVENFPGFYGVMADDILSGTVVCLIMQGVKFFVFKDSEWLFALTNIH